MSTITTKDGTKIFYKDWGAGQPARLLPRWPLTADAWDTQMVFLGERGYRVIAHDRRSHGRSEHTWDDNDMDTYADDQAELIEQLDLGEAILIGHSTRGGEVARYIGRHGTRRTAKAVLLGAVPPLMLKTEANPNGVPMQVFDDIRAGTRGNRSQFFKDLAVPFFGFNRKGTKVSQGLVDAFWLQGMQGGIKGEVDCIKQFSETDFTEDLKRFDVPTLIAHGDDDQIVPIAASALRSAKLVKNATLRSESRARGARTFATKRGARATGEASAPPWGRPPCRRWRAHLSVSFDKWSGVPRCAYFLVLAPAPRMMRAPRKSSTRTGRTAGIGSSRVNRRRA